MIARTTVRPPRESRDTVSLASWAVKAATPTDWTGSSPGVDHQNSTSVRCKELVDRAGFEPATSTLQRWHSPTELPARARQGYQTNRCSLATLSGRQIGRGRGRLSILGPPKIDGEGEVAWSQPY
jgi:hypothetical protein